MRENRGFNKKAFRKWVHGLGHNAEVIAAAKLGVHSTTVVRWMIGESIPRERAALRIHEISGIPESELFPKKRA